MQTEVVEPFDFVLFGATGDLAMRKLIRALYYRCKAGALPVEGRIIGAARSPLDRDGYVRLVDEAAKRFIPAEHREGEQWRRFLERLDYLELNALEPSAYDALAERLGAYPERVRIFYLSTGSSVFAPVAESLHRKGLITERSRIVLEKPLGHDLASAEVINEAVCRYFDESQVFRIDHYLGKETVQNLMVLRFGNMLFENLWHQKYIDHIQITVAETLGVEGRVEFYDKVGAMRDMVQSHLLQLLCIIAMEPPASLDPDAVRDEKLKVLRSLRPIIGRDVDTDVVQGQYTAGAVAGEAVPGYREESGVDDASNTATFVAMRLLIDNWRWSRVPFYLRTGKRLAQRTSEIVVQFKNVPHSIFDEEAHPLKPNRLVIELQPVEGIRMGLQGKRIGTAMTVRDLELNLGEDQRDLDHVPDAYERLLMDAIIGRATLFVRRDEMRAAWQFVEPILDRWAKLDRQPETYVASTWGPSAAAALLARDGHQWSKGG